MRSRSFRKLDPGEGKKNLKIGGENYEDPDHLQSRLFFEPDFPPP